MEIPKMPLAGRLKYFVKIRKTLSRYQKVLDIVSIWEKPLLLKLFQSPIPKGKGNSQKESVMINKKVKKLFTKKAITLVEPE